MEISFYLNFSLLSFYNKNDFKYFIVLYPQGACSASNAGIAAAACMSNRIRIRPKATVNI